MQAPLSAPLFNFLIRQGFLCRVSFRYSFSSLLRSPFAFCSNVCSLQFSHREERHIGANATATACGGALRVQVSLQVRTHVCLCSCCRSSCRRSRSRSSRSGSSRSGSTAGGGGGGGGCPTRPTVLSTAQLQLSRGTHHEAAARLTTVRVSFSQRLEQQRQRRPVRWQLEASHVHY